MANGIDARLQDARPKREEKRARLPWERDALLGERGGKGKRCGNSWIPRWKQCGDGDGREWDEANAEEAAVLARLTGEPFRAGARILATADGIRHAEKNHRHQLTEKDWKQLRGRLFDPRTERQLTDSGRDGKAVQFNFNRGDDPMEAVFTIHFPHRKSPGELRLKTFKMLDPRDVARKQR
jgi:hypothetical protein